MLLFNLGGRSALVTGGSRGIGRACALALAMGGADVAIAGRNSDAGKRTVESIKALGRNSIFVQCDVTVSQQTEAMVEAVVSHFGRLDIAVNNAGIYHRGRDEVQSKDEWDQVIGVNLTGTWLCARAEMRQMVRQRPTEGKIINVGSIMSFMAGSNGSYDASKAGVAHLTRTLAARWGGYNINVNCLSPGYVGTVFGKNRSLQERQRLREVTPLGYVQRLEDLYGPLQFLASRASDYVTGQNLVVDGGHSLCTWMQPLERNVPPRIRAEEEVLGREGGVIT